MREKPLFIESHRLAPFNPRANDVSVVLVDHVGTVVAHVAPERAALYYADWDSAGGWTRLDLGRQLEYVETSATDASAFFLPYIRRGFISQIDDDEVLDTGWIGSDGLAEDIGGGSSSFASCPGNKSRTYYRRCPEIRLLCCWSRWRI